MGLIGDVLHTVGIHWFAVGGEALRRRHHAERALSHMDWDSSGILDALVVVDPCLYYNVREAREAYLPAARMISEEIRTETSLNTSAVKMLIDRALGSTDNCAGDSARVDELAKAIVRRSRDGRSIR